MTTATLLDTYAAAAAALLSGAAAGEPRTLREKRQAAARRFAELGFPTTAEESWRSTSVAAIEKAALPVAGPVKVDAALADRARALAYEGCDLLVFVDGRHAPELSRLGALPDGSYAGSLATALGESPDRVTAALGRAVRFEDHAFAALNTALFADGAFVFLPRAAVLERPLQILYLASGAPVAAFPRTLIVAGEASQAAIVEHYAGPDGATYWTCAVSEVVAADQAIVDHYRVQREGDRAFHTMVQEVELGRGSSVASHAISLGAQLARHDVRARLAGEGGDAILNGLYMLSGSQLSDTHMLVEHEAAHCASHELYKGVLDGRSRGVFNGKIHVHPGAQKTDAKQTNRNLLLSREALANSNPQLEIYADDVKCTHGSTVGQLDADAIFYLRSRGIGVEAAKSLLTYAFASDIVERVKVEPVRRDLEAYLFGWLPMGDVVRQAV